MRYMGSKARIAKRILPIILEGRGPDQWYVEPFVGLANVIHLVGGRRIERLFVHKSQNANRRMAFPRM